MTSAGLCSATFPGTGALSLCCLGDSRRRWSLSCFCPMISVNQYNLTVDKLLALMLFLFYFSGSELVGNSLALMSVFEVRFLKETVEFSM